MTKWTEQIRKAPVQYSGTCKKCGEMMNKGEECPLKLPPHGKGLQSKAYCPMRIAGTTKENLAITPPITQFKPRRDDSKSHNPFTDRN